MRRNIYIATIVASFLVSEGLFAGIQGIKYKVENHRSQVFHSNTNGSNVATKNNVTTKGITHSLTSVSTRLIGDSGRGGVIGREGPNYSVNFHEGGITHHGRLEEGQTAAWHHYSVYVPDGVNKLLVQNLGGFGDGDLYTKGDGIPSSSNYDCRPYLYGNEEECLATGLSSGTDFYYSVHLYDPSYYGSDLTITYNAASGSYAGRTEGFGWPGNTYPQGTMKQFNIHVPEGLEDLVISTSEGSGDADLYMMEGHYANVTTSDYQWASATDGHDSITMSNPPAGTITIGLYAYTSLSNIHVKVRYKAFSIGAASPVGNGNAGPPPPNTYTEELQHNQWGTAHNDGGTHYFHVDVPSSNNYLEIHGYYYIGDMDVYVARDRIPSTSDYDCRSVNSGFMLNGQSDGFGYDNIGSELCRLPNSGSNTYYVMMTTYKGRSYEQAGVLAYMGNKYSKPPGTTGTTAPSSVPDLCNSQGPSSEWELLSNSANQQSFCLPEGSDPGSYLAYFVTVPSSFNIAIKMDHGTGSADLYANNSSNGWANVSSNDGVASVTNYKYSSTKSNNQECIEVSSANFTDSYLHIQVVGQHSGATLQVEMDGSCE